MKSTLFLLGRERDISEAEIRTLLVTTQCAPKHIERTADALIIDHEEELPLSFLHSHMGGTQFIAEDITQTGNIEEDIHAFIHSRMRQGIFDFTLLPPQSERDGLDLKKTLRNAGIRARYIPYHNSATLLHNKLVESGGAFILRNDRMFVITHLHEFESFGERDMGKPRRNARRGMLPPKLARMLINLAGVQHDCVLLDPFCGSGTILIEAADIGIETIYGTDSNSDAIYDSQQNMEWALSTVVKNHPTYKIHTCDVRKLSSQFEKNSIDCIVTEPLMGPPLTGKESLSDIKKSITKLRELYEKALKEFDTILVAQGAVVMTFPCMQTPNGLAETWSESLIQGTSFTVSPLLKHEQTLLYHRPDQWIARRIVRLIKK